MKRTTVSLPDDLAALLSREATRRGTSVSEVVRFSLSVALRGHEKRDIPWAGLVGDEAAVPAARVDEVLAENWTDDIVGDR